MTAHDAGYLTRETPTQPLHYVLELDVAGRVTLDDVRAHVAARLDRVPELHKRARYPLLTGRPVWVDDPEFAVERHVVRWRDPEVADQAAVDATFEAQTLERLPRDRPLWRLVVAEGPGDGATMWLSVHHAVMDGGLLATVLRELFSPEVGPAAAVWQRRRPPTRATLFVHGALRRVKTKLTRAAQPTTSTAGSAEPLATSLTGPVGPHRAVAHTTVSLAAVQSVRRSTGVTINDLFLAAVTEALQGYLSADAPEHVVALVPRDVRRAEEERAIGNRGWSMLVQLPTAVADAEERLALIRAQTEAGKQEERTSGTQGWRFDIALSNVRLGGPHTVAGVPFAGHRVSVPLQGQNRLVCVATSRDDELTLSYTADRDAFPDIDRLASLTRDALDRLTAQTAGGAR
jgi:WS/DGAT/MGAT family acyltransferase